MSQSLVHLNKLSDELKLEAQTFTGGRLAHFVCEWVKLTSDPEILELVNGVKVEFDSRPDVGMLSFPPQPRLHEHEIAAIDDEVQKLYLKKVITKCEPEEGQFISPVFTRPKKDGTFRMILNLKQLNKEITYHHFKMDTLQTALKLITQNCFMASIDLKDAYYSVPICQEDKRLLRFRWKGQLWQFECLPNGIAMAPRKFTKLLKPVFACLRQKGHISTSFLDDSLLVSDSETECLSNVSDTVQLFRSLGFIIHPEKSVLIPSQEIQYLGMLINSKSMSVTLTQEKKEKLRACCVKLKRNTNLKIRDVAKVIGMMVASFSAVKYGPLYYRHLENDKKVALQKNRGNFEGAITLSPAAQGELEWWINNIATASNDILSSEPEVVLTSDASLKGWGCCFQGCRSGGAWLPVEATFHINYLELKAAFFALQCFEKQLCDKTVQLLIDNTTAVACINHFGTSHSPSCNDITFTIWQWCIARNIWITAAHIPGRENTDADTESRKINLDAEWQLNTELLTEALSRLQAQPKIDLFASRINKQLPCYVSYRPDPQAHAVDAFSLSWKGTEFYAFPPFSLVPRVLQKILQEGSTGILVVPKWPTQVWWPVLSKMLTAPPVTLQNSIKKLLLLPSQPHKTHPLLQKQNLCLLVCKISGAGSEKKD